MPGLSSVVAPVFPLVVAAGPDVARKLRALGVPAARCVCSATAAGPWSGVILAPRARPADVFGVVDAPLLVLSDALGALPSALARFLADVHASDTRRWPVSAAAERFGAAWGLAPREREILRLVCEGSARCELPELLGISPMTVETLIRRLRERCRGRRFDDLVSQVQRTVTEVSGELPLSNCLVHCEADKPDKLATGS